MLQNPELYRNQKGVQRYLLPAQVGKFDLLQVMGNIRMHHCHHHLG